MKMVHIPNSANAIPRRSKLGVLILGHAFFFGKSDTIGVEITVASKRFERGQGNKITWFRVKRWT